MFVAIFLECPFMKNHVLMQKEAMDDLFCLFSVLLSVFVAVEEISSRMLIWYLKLKYLLTIFCFSS